MVGFGDIARQAEEKWRADVLEQLFRVRELLEAIALRGDSSHIEVQLDPADSDMTRYDIITEDSKELGGRENDNEIL